MKSSVWMLATIMGCLFSATRVSSQSLSYPTEPDTLAVLRIDVNKLDVQAVADWIKQLMAAKDQQIPVDQFTTAVGSYVQDLRSAGVTELAVMLSAQDLNRGTPLLMTATKKPDSVQELLTTLWQMSPLHGLPTQSQSIDGVLVFGTESSVQRVGDDSGDPDDTRFADDMNRKRHDHQLLISIPDPLRQTLAGLWPEETPSGSPIEFSPRQLMSDLKTLRIEWSLPPEAAFEATMQAIDPQAAKRLNALAARLIEQAPQFSDQINRSVDGETVNIAADASLTADTIANVLNSGYRQNQRRQQSNSMKQIGLAMHNFHAKHKQFQADVMGANGTPLLSWRVAILPFLDQSALFNLIDLSKPWDQQSNESIDRTVVAPYVLSGTVGVKTTLRIPVIQGSLWNASEPVTDFRDIKDGTSNTIAFAVAPADQAVPWMKPGYWRLDEANLVDSFFGDRESATTVFFDGSVQILSKADMTEERLRGLLTIAGGEANVW